MSDQTPYNPLDTKNLGVSVAEALLSREATQLGSIKRFKGAGIYAIYYSGAFDAYRPLSQINKRGNFKVPIYVGKAVPPGARKGGVGLGDKSTTALYARLSDHAESIKLAANLNIKDFYCRYLVVDDIWIPLGESLLIAKFSPLWNRLVDGFGNHDPGKGRYEGLCPRWDILHPGREWATKCRKRAETDKQIEKDIEEYFRSRPLIASGIFRLPSKE